MRARSILVSVVWLALSIYSASCCEVSGYFVTPSHSGPIATALSQVIRGARTSLDIVAPDLLYGTISQAVTETMNRGVSVRVISDKAAAVEPGWLANSGIPTVAAGSRVVLEHQFVVVDGRKVVVGPFNRLNQGVQNGYFDLLVIDCSSARGTSSVVTQYTEAFERLWALFGPVTVADESVRAAPQPVDVILYEVDPARECIWLLNISAAPIDLDGWFLSDLEGRYVFPPETLLIPDEPFSVCIETYNPGYDPQGLYLNDEHDEVYLSTPEGDIVDEVVW